MKNEIKVKLYKMIFKKNYLKKIIKLNVSFNKLHLTCKIRLICKILKIGRKDKIKCWYKENILIIILRLSQRKLI